VPPDSRSPSSLNAVARVDAREASPVIAPAVIACHAFRVRAAGRQAP
jgi:hypothetical protein